MLERCTEIEKANRILLEKMTSILAGPGANFPQNQKGYMPPIPHFQKKKARSRSKSADKIERGVHVKKKSAVSQPRSLNQGARLREQQRITNENEAFL